MRDLTRWTRSRRVMRSRTTRRRIRGVRVHLTVALTSHRRPCGVKWSFKCCRTVWVEVHGTRGDGTLDGVFDLDREVEAIHKGDVEVILTIRA